MSVPIAKAAKFAATATAEPPFEPPGARVRSLRVEVRPAVIAAWSSLIRFSVMSNGRRRGDANLTPEPYIYEMSFSVGAEAYDRFMGRYSRLLAPQFADFANVAADQRVLDVGCGTGALTAELVNRAGPGAVWAVDPSERFVEAVRTRHTEARVQRSAAEELPFEDRFFDAALAQLVVHFMTDPVAGLHEMARVTRADGVVAACVWDHAGDTGPLGLFWEAAHELDPDVQAESHLAGARRGHLGELFRAAGLRDVQESALSVDVEHPSFDEWWEPFTLGVGPAGAYVSRLDSEQQARLRELCRQRLPSAPFVVSAQAWVARGHPAEVATLRTG